MPKAKVTLANMTVSASELAGVLGVTDHNVRLLTREGVLKGQKHHGTRYRYKLAESVRCFVKHREQAAKRGTTSADLAYSSARARKMAAAASLIELQLATARGELHRADDIEFFLVQMLSAFRSRCLSIPSRTMHALVGVKNAMEANQIVEREVRVALTELSEGKFKQSLEFREAQSRYLESKGIPHEMQRNGETPDD